MWCASAHFQGASAKLAHDRQGWPVAWHLWATASSGLASQVLSPRRENLTAVSQRQQLLGSPRCALSEELKESFHKEQKPDLFVLRGEETPR